MSPNNKNNSYVIVTVLDQELEFGIEETTTGQYLFNQIICASGIQEPDYFGLQYTNQRNQTLWLNLEETIWKQVWKYIQWSAESGKIPTTEASVFLPNRIKLNIK